MTATSFELWGPFFIACIVTLAVTPVAIYIAPRIGAIDIPGERRIHKKAMPRFGGMAIYIGMMVALILFSGGSKDIKIAMVGCSMIYVLGAIDDIKELNAISKLVGQIVCAVTVAAAGLRIEFITDYFGIGNIILGDVTAFITTVVWIVAITNAINLIDGLDGLAAGIAAISAICIGYVAYIHGRYLPTEAMMAVAGAAIGFLPFNFHPAKIFMGDSGSQLLGFSIATFSIMGAVKSTTIVVVVIPALVLGLPIIDTLFAIIRRMINKQPISIGDRGHLHHRIIHAGFGQRRGVLIMYCISGIMGLAAILYSRGLMVECIGLFMLAVILVYVLFSDVRRTEPIKKDGDNINIDEHKKR